ncbi:MAG: hypothetical protein ACD_51C00137G0003 [uncultured bacterium]|nr:MAG: hypothetical protein ACD_51C00137G0003 [uncultured bacterium]
MNGKKSLNFDFLDDGPKKAENTVVEHSQPDASSQLVSKGENDVEFLQYFKECYTDFDKFSEKYLTRKTPRYFLIAILIYGMGSAADRMIGSIGDYSSWGEVWVITAIGGLIGGFIAYYIAGTIYHWRVKWSKGHDDENTSKHIWLFSGLPIAVTGLLSLIFNQMAYGNDYFNGEGTAVDGIILFVSIAAIIYSINISYKAVRHVQKVEKGRAIWWFIVAPAIFYIIVFGIGFASGL